MRTAAAAAAGDEAATGRVAFAVLSVRTRRRATRAACARRATAIGPGAAAAAATAGLARAAAAAARIVRAAVAAVRALAGRAAGSCGRRGRVLVAPPAGPAAGVLRNCGSSEDQSRQHPARKRGRRAQVSDATGPG